MSLLAAHLSDRHLTSVSLCHLYGSISRHFPSSFSHPSLFSFPRRVKPLGIVLSKSPPLHHNSVWSVDFYIMVFCEAVLTVLCP